jgi:hypothetical protein
LLRDGLLDIYDHTALVEELANVRLRETRLPGVVRVDHDPGRHDDIAQDLGFAVTALLERTVGGDRILVAEGYLPPVRLTRPFDCHAEPPVPFVREGEERPTDRLLSFQRARHNPRYTPPGGGRR